MWAAMGVGDGQPWCQTPSTGLGHPEGAGKRCSEGAVVPVRQ